MTLTNSVTWQLNDPRPNRLVRATLHHHFVASSLPGLRFALVALIAMVSVYCAAAEQTYPPDFSTISQTVQRYFASFDDYKPGDLITQSQVEAALSMVEETGWEIPDNNAIVKLALPDDSFLIKELSSPRGKQFMRKLAKYPGTYSRLDRLSTISQGHKVVRELIASKGGELMIDYMATTKGGENLGRMMAGAEHGVDLNKPTGRIYTAEDLVAVLERENKKSKP